MASRLLYAEIGRDVTHHAFDSVSRRAVVSRRRKLSLLARAFIGTSLPQSMRHEPPAPEAAFLVDAVRQAGDPILPPQSFDDRLAFVSNLFMRLEQSQSKGDVS